MVAVVQVRLRFSLKPLHGETVTEVLSLFLEGPFNLIKKEHLMMLEFVVGGCGTRLGWRVWIKEGIHVRISYEAPWLESNISKIMSKDMIFTDFDFSSCSLTRVKIIVRVTRCHYTLRNKLPQVLFLSRFTLKLCFIQHSGPMWVSPCGTQKKVGRFGPPILFCFLFYLFFLWASNRRPTNVPGAHSCAILGPITGFYSLLSLLCPFSLTLG